MTKYWPQPHQVRLVRDAEFSRCLECGYSCNTHGSWDWRSSEWLHRDGTGHTRFARYGYRWPADLEVTRMTQPTTYTCQAIKSDGKPCGYTWTPRPKRFEQGRSKPVQCPHCQSKLWDEPHVHDKKGD